METTCSSNPPHTIHISKYEHHPSLYRRWNPPRKRILSTILSYCTARGTLLSVLYLTYMKVGPCTVAVLHCTWLTGALGTVMHCTSLYCTVLYCTLLHCTLLHCNTLYCTVLYTVLYCTVPDWQEGGALPVVLYCTWLIGRWGTSCGTVLYYTVLFCTWMTGRWGTTSITVLYYTVLYLTDRKVGHYLWHCAILYYTVLYMNDRKVGYYLCYCTVPDW